MHFSDAGYGTWMYKTVIDADGTFNLNETLSWLAPKSLYLNRVTIRAGSRPPVVDPDEPDPEEIQKLIDACAGDWAAAPDDVVTLKKDGTLTYRGTEYTPEFSIGKYNSLSACITTDEGRIYFDFYVDEGEMYGGRRRTYYRGRTWEQVVLTAENFLDYYELTETTTWKFNAFGEFEYVAIDQFVTMKEEYRDRFDEKCSTLTAVKAYVDACGAISSEVDLASRTYSISPLEDDNLGSHRERIWEATSVERPCSMYWYYSMPHLPNGYTAKLHTAYVTNFTVLDVIGTLWLINN